MIKIYKESSWAQINVTRIKSDIDLHNIIQAYRISDDVYLVEYTDLDYDALTRVGVKKDNNDYEMMVKELEAIMTAKNHEIKDLEKEIERYKLFDELNELKRAFNQ